MSVIVLGTLALDSLKTPSGKRNQILGGSAVHFAMAAKFFTKVNLVAVAGEDFPKKYLGFLKKNKIDLSSVSIEKGLSFRWKGEYKGSLNQAVTLDTQLGVLSGFRPKISDAQKRIKYVFLANLDPQIQRHLLRRMSSPKLVGLDSMNYWIKNKRKSLIRLLKEVDLYTANDSEAQELSGEKNLIKSAIALRKLGAPRVIIKKGEHGILFYCDQFIFCVPAYPVHRLVDPTGAGDAFAGGFMGYLANKNNLGPGTLRRAVVYGSACASFNVEGFGVERISRVKIKQIDKRFAALKKITNF